MWEGQYTRVNLKTPKKEGNRGEIHLGPDGGAGGGGEEK